MYLLTDLTGNTTGEEPWIFNSNPGTFMLAISASSDLGGGTLEVQLADDNDEVIYTSTELTFTELPTPQVIYIPAGIKVRAQLTGGAAPSVPFLRLIPADSDDMNRWGKI